MPLEYYANMNALQVGRGLGAETDAPVVRIQPRLNERDLQKRIRKLPFKTQMQILTEIRYCPEMRERILALLQRPEAFQAIVIDQMLAIQEVYQPGSSPEHAALWPMLQNYARAALKAGLVTGQPPVENPESLKGLGLNPEPAWSTARYRKLDYHDMLPMGIEGLGDGFSDLLKQATDFWEKDGKKIYDQYGKPVVDKTIADMTGGSAESPAVQQASAASDAELAARMKALEQQAQEKEEPEKKSIPGWLPVLALVGAAAVALLVVVKKVL